MRLRIRSTLYRKMTRALAEAGLNETGGVLMGEQLAPGNFRLVDFTVATRTGGPAHFERSAEEHGQKLEGFFGDTGNDYGRFNYLGEWHSHPRDLPLPSRQDILAMRALLDEDPHIPFAVLLICRAIDDRLALSATLFQPHLPHEEVEIVDDACSKISSGVAPNVEDDDPE